MGLYRYTLHSIIGTTTLGSGYRSICGGRKDGLPIRFPFVAGQCVTPVDRLQQTTPQRHTHSITLRRPACAFQSSHHPRYALPIITSSVPDEVSRRVGLYHQPYRECLHSLLDQYNVTHVLSIHSFTECYEGHKRDVEIGILCREEHPASVVLSDKVRQPFNHSIITTSCTGCYKKRAITCA